MEFEHEEAGVALAQLRQLTDDYKAPEWACNTYRAMLDALLAFERDLHQHVHKENNVLFPGAIALEKEKSA
jgi:regulator of cell morphogenesis and NO signaling